MNSISSISLSGMNAAQTQLSTSASNLANLSTEGFRGRDVVQQADANGGVTTTVVAAADQQRSIEADVVQQLQAKNAFLANLAVFKSGNQLLGTLVNAQV